GDAVGGRGLADQQDGRHTVRLCSAGDQLAAFLLELQHLTLFPRLCWLRGTCGGCWLRNGTGCSLCAGTPDAAWPRGRAGVGARGARASDAFTMSCIGLPEWVPRGAAFLTGANYFCPANDDLFCRLPSWFARFTWMMVLVQAPQGMFPAHVLYWGRELLVALGTHPEEAVVLASPSRRVVLCCMRAR
ncbi:hypothetical protein NDU88_006041, partial [Pleurodeles waltl]